MGCLQVTFAPNPGSVLWSHLCRSSSVTRSTAMKRTCRKSLQPSKVSQGCLPNCPRKSWLLPHPWHTGLLGPTALIFLECPASRQALRQGSPKRQEQALSSSSATGPLAAGLIWPCPLSHGCPVWLRLAPILSIQALCTPRAPAHNLPFVRSPCLSPSLVEPLRSPCGE